MIEYGGQFLKDSVDKQLSIVTDDGQIHITNNELHQEQFELTESLCSESELTFGSCEAGMVKFTVSNIFSGLKDKWITIQMVLAGNTANPFQIGRYKVYSDTPEADRTKRDIVAYDTLYDMINADVAEWYNTLLPDKDSTTTMKAFRNSFFGHFGIEQADIQLVNDGVKVEKTVEPEELSGATVLNCICEINGCFGHIGRDGRFHYIYLEQEIQGLYPRNDLYPADDLYPREPKSMRIGKNLYISARYEDFLVKSIDKLQIRKEEDDIGVIVGSGTNAYVIQDNFLVYGKGNEELTGIANNIYEKIRGIIYRPFSADCKGNLCIEVGDAVRLPTRYEIIESYVLKRTLKGIQALRDEYEATGEEYRSTQVNSVHKSIIQLKGKTNVLTRTIEETNSKITDVESGLSSEIKQTATDIRAEVKNTADGLSSSIEQTAESITSEVKRAKQSEEELSSKITQTAESITSEVVKKYETKDGTVEALKNVSLSIEQGDIYGIIGMSGAGKSTLVRCMNFLEEPTEGQVLIKGRTLGSLSKKELRKQREDIGMIFQHFNLLMQKSVIDNVCFPLYIQGKKKKEARAKALELLEIVGLQDRAKAYPAQLSGGQKQRVAIARALASNPKILLCDEATSALDPQTTASILELLESINKRFGITIVIITHQMSVVREICTHVAIMKDGKVAEKGLVTEIFEHPKSEVARELINKDTGSDVDGTRKVTK